MTLNDLELPKLKVLVIFLRFWVMTHILRVKCAKMAGDRRKQLAYRFLLSNVEVSSLSFDPLGLRSHTCVRGRQKGVLL